MGLGIPSRPSSWPGSIKNNQTILGIARQFAHGANFLYNQREMRSTFLIVLMVLLGSSSARGQECPYVNLWLLVDNSGSIESAELQQAVRAAVQALDTWGLSMNQGTLWVGASYFAQGYQRVSLFTASVASIQDSLKTIAPTGSDTDIIGAVRRAMQEFPANESRFLYGVNIIILMSDGIDTYTKPSPEIVVESRLARQRDSPGFLFWVVDISRAYDNGPSELGGARSKVSQPLGPQCLRFERRGLRRMGRRINPRVDRRSQIHPGLSIRIGLCF